jgi:hypothetical protein
VTNQAWQYYPENGTIASMDGGGTCLSVGYPGDVNRGAKGTLITTAPCDPTLPATQVFLFNPAAPSSTIVHALTGRCVDAGHFGQLIRYNPAYNPAQAWTLDRVSATSCPDPGNPPFLPRSSFSDYTVGVGNVQGSDLLLILDGDSQDKNVWSSKDCGVNWQCYDGSQPWPSGRALAVVLQAPTDMSQGQPTNPIFMFGGVNYNATDDDGIPYWTNDMYVSYDGVSFTPYTPKSAPGLPTNPDPITGAQAVWPGMAAADWENIYLFGDETFDDPNSIFKLSRDSFYLGWTQMDFPTYTSNVNARSRYTFLAGTPGNGCWLATDYNAGAVWGLPDANTYSTNTFYTSFDFTEWRQGPVSAPWLPRAGAAITPTGPQSSENRGAWVVGGMEFSAGAPTPGGSTFSDAWLVTTAACLYADNGEVCSGEYFGSPDLDNVVCNCTQPHQGFFCDLCPASTFGPDCESCLPCVHGSCVGNGTITGDGSCACDDGWTGPDCSIPDTGTSPTPTQSPSPTPSPTPAPPGTTPSPTPTHSRSPTPTRSARVFPPGPPPGPAPNPDTPPAPTPPALSSGAVGAIVFFALLGALGAGVYVYATYFGGGAVVGSVLAALAKPFAGMGGGGGGSVETRGLLKPGMAKGTLSASQAAGRLAGPQFSASAGSAPVVSSNPLASKGNAYQSF